MGAVVSREVLYRELYRGVIVWNKSRKRDQWGQHRQRPKAESEWLRVPAPHLQIVPDTLWDAVHERLAGERRRYLRLNNGKLLGRAPGTATAKYLLSGMLTCGLCGSSLEGRTRSHGRLRVPFYGCAANRRKGGTVCTNNLEIPMADADAQVLATVEKVMLDPSVLEEIVMRAMAQLTMSAATDSSNREALARDLAALDAELATLADALAAGGATLATVLSAIKSREERRADLQRTLAGVSRQEGLTADMRQLRAKLEERVKDWRGLPRKHAEQGQQLLRRLIVGRLALIPERDEEGRYYRFTGQGTYSRLLAGLVPHMVASPRRPTRLYLAGPLAA